MDCHDWTYAMIESPLASCFERYFNVVPATTDELLAIVYRLRHQVYCEELHYEPTRASQMEHDEYDRRSIHCLLFHRFSQSYIGCVRLILADSQNAELPFPFELVCGTALQWRFDAAAGSSRRQYGEISRLAIAARFRRRRGEPLLGHDNGGNEDPDPSTENERRLFPSIALGLYVAITAMGLNQGLDGVFAMMEPRLARQLRRFGLNFEQVGSEIEHRGMRAPFFLGRDNLLKNLKPECRVLLATIQEHLSLASRHAKEK
jgi:N-acyl amino acid synthase of PEP-CTERM/exosortase system